MTVGGRIAVRLLVGAKLLGALLALLVMLVGGALLLLQTDRGRAFVCSSVLDAVNGAIPGTILVERCAVLTPSFIRLEGVTIQDPHDREIVRAEAVEAEPDLAALLAGNIRIERVLAEGPWFRLIDDGAELAIVSAFVSPNEQEEDEGETDFQITFGMIEVVRGTLTDLPDGLSLRNIAGRTTLAVEQAVTLDVKAVGARAEHDQETLCRLLDASGELSFGHETLVKIQATLEAQGQKAEVDAVFDGALEGFSLEATIRTLEGRLELSSKNDAGQLEIKLNATGLNLGDTPVVDRGVARANLHAVAWFSQPAPSLDAFERVNVHGDIGFSGLALSEMQADEVTMQARIEGSMPAPMAQLVVKADGVEIQGVSIESARLSVQGEDGHYDVAGRAPLPNGWIVGMDFVARVGWPAFFLDGKASLENAPFSPIEAEFSQLVIQPSQAVSADVLSVSGSGVELTARGRYGFNEGSEISFDLRTLDLAILGEAFELHPRLEGVLRGSGRFRGTRERPELEATFELEEGAIESVPIESLRATVRYAARQTAQADLRVDLGENGTLALRTNATIEPAGGVSSALRTARYDARLVVDALSMSILSRLTEGFPAMVGTLSSEITARGELDSLDFDLTAQGRRISGPSLSSSDVLLEAKFARGDLNARLEVASQKGGKVVATAHARMDLQRLLGESSAASILDNPWEVSLQVPDQRWSSLPLEVELPTPARVSLIARASGGRGSIVADIDVDLRMPGGPSTSVVRPAVCTHAEPARLRARARLRDQRTSFEVEGYVARKQLLRTEVQAQTPILAWLRQGFPLKWPAAQAVLELDPVALGSVPILCEQAKGELQARLHAAGLFNPSQEMSLRLEARELRLENETPVDVLVQAKATATRATVEVGVDAKEKHVARLHAEAPLDVATPGCPVALGAGELRASADFDNAPLSFLLASVPGVGRPSGNLDGHLAVSGDAQDLSTLELRGDVQLVEVSMTLKDPFLRLDQVNADLAVQADQLIVKSLSARDRDGRIEVQGTIGLSGWEPSEVALNLKGDQLPLRQAGIVIATFNGKAELTGDLSADPRILRMELGKEVSIVLPDELQYGVQDLSPHPLVIYEGQPGFDRSLSVTEALNKHRQGEPEIEERPPLTVHAISTEPFWVRRPDFSMQLSVDLEVHSEENATWIQGDVDLPRGFLVLLNKNFDVRSGSIRFTGSTPIDPTVDLSATHRLRSGYTVTIDVKGRVSSPELTLSSDAPDADTNAEIVALLLGTGRQGAGSQDADSQTRSVLAGLTAGLIGSVARRELGQYAPIIAVESSGTAETTGFRAGFAIGDLIPEAWQDVLLGVYVEGLLAGSQQGPQGGFLLEFLLPHNLSTTTTYEQPDNWSLDFLWQP